MNAGTGPGGRGRVHCLPDTPEGPALTEKLQFKSFGADELAFVFEELIPFNNLLGLRCLGNRVGVAELRAFHPGSEDRPVAAGMGVYSVKRDNGDEGGTWEWQSD